jgi:hypothetical protein
MHVGLGRPSAVTGGLRGGSGGSASRSLPCSSRRLGSRPCSLPVRCSGKGSGGPTPAAEVAPLGAAMGAALAVRPSGAVMRAGLAAEVTPSGVAPAAGIGPSGAAMGRG